VFQPLLELASTDLTHALENTIRDYTLYCVFFVGNPNLLYFRLTSRQHSHQIIDNPDRKLGERKMMGKRFLWLVPLVLLLPALSGCWYVAAAGAGAAVGYYAVGKGYKVQSPVTYETPKEHKQQE
jgi:hypothetical protein